MGFLKKNKRKQIEINNINQENPINYFLTKEIITDGHGSANFNRLFYKNCPVLPMPNRRTVILKDKKLVIANRKKEVIKICNGIHALDASDRTKINIFNETVRFLKLLDSKNIEDVFSIESIQIFINALIALYHKGTKGRTLASRQNSFKILIQQYDNELYSQCENIFFSFPKEKTCILPYTDKELKELVSTLFTIYNNYSKHFENDTIPNIFPLYKKNESFDKGPLNYQRGTFSSINPDTWIGDLIRVAYYITSFYTGINASPLLMLKHSDLHEEPFQNVSRQTYKLQTKKGRQAGKINEINVGFTQKAKCFFEGWIKISKKINENKNGFLFPNIFQNKLSAMTSSSIAKLNKTFISLGLPALSNQRFRKTKASLIMRATESIVLVAQGMNNSIETSSKYYSDGDPVSMEFSLSSALYIREQTALGRPLNTVIEESSFIFKDPLKNNQIGKQFKKLSNGLRCNGAFSEKAKKLKNALIKEGLANDDDKVACYKFLECFGCVHHAVVADIDDIWLMLSFSDVILEELSRPAVNSTPSILLNKVNNTIQNIIHRMETEYSNLYIKAYDKYLEQPHPLWLDVSDLKLLRGIY